MSVPEPPWRRLYPFASHFLALDGHRLHYLDEGPREAPAVLLVHGNPTWSFYFRTLIPELARRHRVIVPDHLGCGLSDKPQVYPYNLEQHVRNLTALVDHLGLARFSLVLHDWGGAIGMGLATRRPAAVDRLVVCNTAAFYVPFCPWRIRVCRLPVLGAVLVRGLNGFSRGALHFATSQRRRFTTAVRAGYLAPYDSWRHRVAVHRFVRDIPLEPGHPTRATLDAIAAGLPGLAGRPLRIFWGADDFCFTPRHFLPRWRQLFPAAEVTVLEGAGHYVIEDAHERLLPDLTRFLTEDAP